MDEDLDYEYNETETNLRFFEILRRYSDNKHDCVAEWELLTGHHASSKQRCICSTRIENQYFIRHKRTGKVLVIGSECVKRWMNPVLNCKGCGDPLGRVCERIRKEDFLCRQCKKASADAAKETEAKIEKMGRLLLFWYGKYYMKPFSLVAEDIPYVEYLINLPQCKSSETLKAFQKYATLVFEIKEVEFLGPKKAV
jgi:hypothetical protein